MATTLMHLYVGKYFADHCNEIHRKDQFYLGCIAPDCIHMSEHNDKPSRWAAHLRDEDLNKWHQNITNFYKRNQTYERNYLLGFLIHNLTDVVWDEYYIQELRPRILSSAYPTITNWDEFLQDCFRFDFEQLRAVWWIDEVCPALKASVCSPIHTINADLLNRYRNFVVNEYRDTVKEGKPLLISQEVVDELAKRVMNHAEKFL